MLSIPNCGWCRTNVIPSECGTRDDLDISVINLPTVNTCYICVARGVGLNVAEVYCVSVYFQSVVKVSEEFVLTSVLFPP